MKFEEHSVFSSTNELYNASLGFGGDLGQIRSKLDLFSKSRLEAKCGNRATPPHISNNEHNTRDII